MLHLGGLEGNARGTVIKVGLPLGRGPQMMPRGMAACLFPLTLHKDTVH